MMGVIKGGQGLEKNLQRHLEAKEESLARLSNNRDPFKVNLIDLAPREDLTEDNLTPVEELKMVQIDSKYFQTIQIGSNLF